MGRPGRGCLAAAHPESVGRLVVIDGYPGSSDGSGSVVDYKAAGAERERAFARHASQPWYPTSRGSGPRCG
jgi:pimeloyl-ACP methyl ester carboxylesterase